MAWPLKGVAGIVVAWSYTDISGGVTFGKRGWNCGCKESEWYWWWRDLLKGSRNCGYTDSRLCWWWRDLWKAWLELWLHGVLLMLVMTWLLDSVAGIVVARNRTDTSDGVIFGRLGWNRGCTESGWYWWWRDLWKAWLELWSHGVTLILVMAWRLKGVDGIVVARSYSATSDDVTFGKRGWNCRCEESEWYWWWRYLWKAWLELWLHGVLLMLVMAWRFEGVAEILVARSQADTSDDVSFEKRGLNCGCKE